MSIENSDQSKRKPTQTSADCALLKLGLCDGKEKQEVVNHLEEMFLDWPSQDYLDTRNQLIMECGDG